jgi:hypothetical protein
VTSRWGAWRSAAIAGLCLALGSVLAWCHPLAPLPVLALFLATSAFVAWQPKLWLWLLPAALPILDFAPWTGGLIVEEFDLLVLAVAAGLQLRRTLDRGDLVSQPAAQDRPGSLLVGFALLFGACSVVSLVRGIDAAGGLSIANGWFQGYAGPLNSWRVFKSVAWAAMLWPLLQRELQEAGAAALRRFAAGVLSGLLVVVIAVVWERAAYPGLWEFSGHYRTTALFWEMHVGGGAIDVYLALAAPFVAWALWSVRSPGWWSAAAVLALLTVYACLTTFSRGVYFAVAVPLAGLGLALVWRRVGGRMRHTTAKILWVTAALVVADGALAFAFEAGGYLAAAVVCALLAGFAAAFVRWVRPVGRRTAASFALALALLLEVFAVLGLGTFMRERMAAADNDYVSRQVHWRQGLGLMRTTADRLWGIGAGRLPAGYATQVPGVELPGDAIYQPGSARNGSLLLLGPKTRSDIAGLLLVNQRIALRTGRGHRVDLDVRVTSFTELYLRVCEAHLLYARECQTALLPLLPDPTGWRHLSVRLAGRSLSVGDPAWPRRAIFSMAVVNEGGAVEIDELRLKAPDGGQLLSNGDFSAGMAHWLPTAMSYFVPWHIDNLYLELLVERGLPALLAFACCAVVVVWRLLRARGEAGAAAPFIVASLCGALCAGLVNSVMDVPRVAFLLLFMMMLGAELGRGINAPASSAKPAA